MDLKLINKTQILKVNKKIIYESQQVFGYTIDVTLKKFSKENATATNATNATANFYKCYT